MDFIRLDLRTGGPTYIRPEHIVRVGRADPAGESSCITVVYPHGEIDLLVVVGDPDEIAMLIERCLPGCRIHRAN